MVDHVPKNETGRGRGKALKQVTEAGTAKNVNLECLRL